MHPCLNQTKASLTVRNDPMEIIFWCALHVWKATIFRPLIPKTVQNCPLKTSVIATSAWLKQDVQKSCAIPQISIGVAKYVNRCSNSSKRSKIEIQTKQLRMTVVPVLILVMFWTNQIWIHYSIKHVATDFRFGSCNLAHLRLFSPFPLLNNSFLTATLLLRPFLRL